MREVKITPIPDFDQLKTKVHQYDNAKNAVVQAKRDKAKGSNLNLTEPESPEPSEVHEVPKASASLISFSQVKPAQTLVQFKNPYSYVSDAQKIKIEADKRIMDMKPIRFGHKHKKSLSIYTIDQLLPPKPLQSADRVFLGVSR